MNKITLHMIGAFGCALLLPLSSSLAGPVTDEEFAGLNAQPGSVFDETYVHLTRLPLSLRSVHVAIGIEDASTRRQLSERDLERLRSEFQSDLERGHASPGGTVSLEVTLVDLVPNFVLASNGGRTARHRPSSGIGSATMEAVFRNAETGEVLMVIRDKREGLGLTHNPHMITQQVWGDVTDILDDWAQDLPNAL